MSRIPELRAKRWMKIAMAVAIVQKEIDVIVAKVKRGDLTAFEIIVRRYEGPLRAWLATHSQPGIDVDEVAQRTFVATYSNLDKYQLGTNFSAWLFTIARYQLQSGGNTFATTSRLP